MEDIIDHFEDGIDESLKDWNTFVGAKMDYYIPKWVSLGDRGIISFNFAAFICGLFWMLYRKMYLYALFYGIILFAAGALEEIILETLGLYEYSRTIGNITNIAYATVLSCVANWIYKKHATNKIAELKMKGLSTDEYQLQLEKIGGTNIVAPIIAVIGFILFIGLALYSLGLASNF